MAGGGSKPGERRGGRRVGSANLLTIERELIAKAVTRQAVADGRRREQALVHLERQADAAADAVQKLREQGKPLAKDAMALFLEIFMGRAAHYQPRVDLKTMAETNKQASEEKFEKWARLSVETAKALAPFQSPTFRAIVVQPPPPSHSEQQVRRFTLAVFDNHNGHTIEAVATTDEAIAAAAEEDDDEA